MPSTRAQPLDLDPVHAIGALNGGDRPLVHFAHATGMCAAVYHSMLARLSPHVDVIASDARGHGATGLPADPAMMVSWDAYVDDLIDLLRRLPPAPRLILSGHSMGATVSLLAAARLGAQIDGIVLIEPAFVPLAVAPTYDRSRWPNPMAAQAARRRAVWPSREVLRAAYRGRGVFADWSDGDLDAYVVGGVRDRSDGDVELACTPAWEAATFAAVSTEVAGALAQYPGPVTVLHGTVGSTVLAADAVSIAQRPATRVRCFAGAGHFLPLVEPAAMARELLAAAGAGGK